MRVHPSQLSQGFFTFLGPSTLWVKSFNLNNKKIVLPLCLLFLFSVIGSALNKEHIGNIKNKLSHIFYSNNSLSETVAVILSDTNSKIFLFSAPARFNSSTEKSSLDLSNLELSTTDKVLLEESKKLGSISVIPLSAASELPLLRIKSVVELQELLALKNTPTPSPTPTAATAVNYLITSRIFIPGESKMYGITDDGTIVEIHSDGMITESKGG